MSNLLSWSSVTLAVALGFSFASSGGARAQMPHRVAEPASHANLAVYVLRGASTAGPVPLTLAEALASGAVTVHETGSVNELHIEHAGREDVFVQAGDIVKGGQQDRVLTVSLLLQPGAGRVPIGAYCVEQGRWAARGKEDVKRFASAEKAVPSREAKLAMLMPDKPQPAANSAGLAPAGEASAGRRPTQQAQAQTRTQSETGSRQSEVWANVGRIQDKLSANLKARVASGQSASSLQLSLENEALAAARADYVKVLQDAGAAGDDIVGVAFAINGRISSAEIYPSNGLFQKMWPKLLDAAATEAIGERQAASASLPTAADVAAFLKSADQAKAASPTKLSGGLSRSTFDGVSTLAVATQRADGGEVHRTYLAK